MIVAAKDARVKRFVYATSSYVYGDHPELPRVEEKVGHPLSPYAATKMMNEVYADVFARVYGLQSVGLRYFNGFGPRRDPNSPYTTVIPRWFAALTKGHEVCIHGDGETSRDFCYIKNVVQANLLAACTDNPDALNQVYNVACGERTTLNGLFDLIRSNVAGFFPNAARMKPVYCDFRPGDIRHCLANISKARMLLGYEPQYSVRKGLEKAGKWYMGLVS
jgi:UDP-N-acetylglucosamine 4-epimerase